MATVNTRPQPVFEPAILVSVLGLVFITFGYSLVAYISARAYIDEGSPVFLLMGGALLAIAGASTISSFYVSDSNVRITILSVGFFVSALLQVLSGGALLISERESKQPDHAILNVVLSYSVVLAFGLLLTFASVQGLTPPFFIQGTGGTPLRDTLNATTIILFSLASLAFFTFYRRTHSNVQYWYCMALILVATSLFASYFATSVGGDLTWTARVGQYMSGLYFLALVLTNLQVKPQARETTP